MENLDFNIFQFIHYSGKNDFFDFILPFCRNKTTWIPLYFLLIYTLWKNFRQDYWKIIIGSILTVAFSDILCAKGLKPFFMHIRPCHLYLSETWFSDFHLCSQTYSMPSCHAFNHMALVIFIFPNLSKKWKWILSFWVILIGYSQIYVGVHFPKDILVGLVLGAIVGYSFRILFKNILMKLLKKNNS